MSFNYGTQDPYVKTGLVGAPGSAASTNAAGGITFGVAQNITDKATGGAIGTAATTVDVASIFYLNQTTASQTVSLPTPTVTTDNKQVILVNVGSQAVTIFGASLATGAGVTAIYTGSAWAKI